MSKWKIALWRDKKVKFWIFFFHSQHAQVCKVKCWRVQSDFFFISGPYSQCSNGVIWLVKKMSKNSEGAMKTSSLRVSKWAPTWHSCMVAPKSLYDQPLDQVWIRLARKGFWSYHTAMSIGGSFWSSWWARFHSVLRILGIFLQPKWCHLNIVMIYPSIKNSIKIWHMRFIFPI